MTLAHILTDEQARILVEERRALAELRLALERVAMDDEDAASFDASAPNPSDVRPPGRNGWLPGRPLASPAVVSAGRCMELLDSGVAPTATGTSSTPRCAFSVSSTCAHGA